MVVHRAVRAASLPLVLSLGAMGVASRAQAAANVLTLAWEAEPRTIDPRFAVDANSQYLEDLLHCSLIQFDRDGHIVPGLAERWEWTTPTVLTMTLKPHITFADGSPVTAADAAATYQAFKQVGSTASRKGAFRNLLTMTAKDPATVVAQLATPDASFVANLAVGILPVRLANGPQLTDKDTVSGCGPFVLKAGSSSTFTLTANQRYNLGPVPKLQEVAIKIVKDENTRFAKLSAGELDLVQNLLNRDKLTVLGRDYPQFNVQRRPGVNTAYIGFNTRDPVLANKLVRQAISRAIDKQKIIKYIMDGMATPADGILPASDPFHAKNLSALTYDPAAAKKLLDEAGYKADPATGKRFSLSYKTSTDQTRVLVAKAIAAELRQIGIILNIETLEWGRFKADVDHGRVQMWSLSWVGFKDPDIYRYAFSSTMFPPDGGIRGWFANAKLDRLLQDGIAQTEPAKRAAVYEQVERLLLDEAPYVFLWHEDVFAVVKSQVEGFEVYADGRLSSLATAAKH